MSLAVSPIFRVALSRFDQPLPEFLGIRMVAACFWRDEMEGLLQRRFDTEWLDESASLNLNAKH